MFLDILQVVIGAALIGLGGLTCKYIAKYHKRHKQHHVELDMYPTMFAEHKAEHVAISGKLDMVSDANVTQMRTQMLQIHDKAMAEGGLSKFWKQQFYETYTVYISMGGNSFVEDLKRDIDAL